MRFILIASLFYAFNLLAQTTPLSHLEAERQHLLEQSWQLSLKKQALNQRLRPLQIQIDSLQKAQANLQTINPRQKEALTYSQQIVLIQERLDSLHARLASVNARLFRVYSRQIDSLRQALQSAKKPAQKDILSTQIERLRRKRLQVSPELKTLSLNLENIRKLNLNQVQDSLKKAILIDYLQNALNEIDRQRQYLEIKGKELRQMQRLQQKALSFVEEIDDAQMTAAAPFQQNPKTNMAPQTSDDRDGAASFMSTPSSASASGVVVDLPQIDRLINQSLQGQSPVPIDSALKAIERTRAMLKMYRQIIQDKLKQ